MNRFTPLAVGAMALLPGLTPHAHAAENDKPIVLVAGAVQKVDRVGHHDYEAGCALLADLLRQTAGVKVTVVKNGWPENESVFDDAACVLFYTDGGGRQAYLRSKERIARMHRFVADGVGIVNVHQAVDYPDAHTADALKWIGGAYVRSKSGRGHWDSRHETFVDHPVSRGVTPWSINDGWLNQLVFTEAGVTPLLWSGKAAAGSSKGGAADVVAWAFERPDGGRSFSFTGLDAHDAWERPGVRQMMVNGVLWAAGVKIPAEGASCQADADAIRKHLTPRQSKQRPAKKAAQAKP